MKEDGVMADRIDVEEARDKVTEGEALLVCAYEDDSKCDRIKLDLDDTLPEAPRVGAEGAR